MKIWNIANHMTSLSVIPKDLDSCFASSTYGSINGQITNIIEQSIYGSFTYDLRSHAKHLDLRIIIHCSSSILYTGVDSTGPQSPTYGRSFILVLPFLYLTKIFIGHNYTRLTNRMRSMAPSVWHGIIRMNRTILRWLYKYNQNKK